MKVLRHKRQGASSLHLLLTVEVKNFKWKAVQGGFTAQRKDRFLSPTPIVYGLLRHEVICRSRLKRNLNAPCSLRQEAEGKTPCPVEERVCWTRLWKRLTDLTSTGLPRGYIYNQNMTALSEVKPNDLNPPPGVSGS